MRSLFLLVVASGVVAGNTAACSSSQTPEEAAAAKNGDAPTSTWTTTPAVSGTRLRTKVITGGGAREVIGFHDVERNEDCTFQKADGEKIRCMPTLITSSQTGLFSDAACQTPLLVASISNCTGDRAIEPKYAIVYRYDNQCGRQISSEIRTATTDAAAVRYSNNGNGCAAQPPNPGTVNQTSVTLGDVIPWTAFVEATETIVPGSEGISEKVLVTPDGARQHAGFRIESLDAKCSFQVMADGIARCIPEGTVGGVTYKDSNCTEAGFVSSYQNNGPCSTATNNLWIEPKGEACGGVNAVYSLAAGVVTPTATLYERRTTRSGGTGGDVSTTCNSLGGLSGSGSFGDRRPIEANVTASLPKAGRIGSGSGRLVPALVSVPSSTTGDDLTLGWHDMERNVDCTFTLASDGKLRCLPAAASATVFFTDTACKSPSVVAVLNNTPCFTDAKFARVVDDLGSCQPKTRVISLGATPRDLTNASTSSGGRCPTFTAVKNAFDATDVDVAGFVEGTLVTE